MTKEQLAALLNGRQYRAEITREEEALAKAAGLLVIFGASDDLMEFRGAIHDELGAGDGTTARITPAGEVLGDWPGDDGIDEEGAEAYFRKKLGGWVEVEAVWDPRGESLSWAMKTSMPHAPFLILEGGEGYCRGIVISMADVAEYKVVPQ